MGPLGAGISMCCVNAGPRKNDTAISRFRPKIPKKIFEKRVDRSVKTCESMGVGTIRATAMIMKKMSETKEKLLQVGFDLIWDSSYGSVRVDDICKRAGINKGSIYNLITSNADQVVEAYDAYWQQKRPDMDRIFSPQAPPLQRIHNLCLAIYADQHEKAEKYGHVCGCPFASVGSEVATVDEKIRAKSEQLMSWKRKYFESTIADAIREGSVTVKDPVIAARTLESLLLGMLVEARVQNDLKVLENMESTILDLIGAKVVGV